MRLCGGPGCCILMCLEIVRLLFGPVGGQGGILANCAALVGSLLWATAGRTLRLQIMSGTLHFGIPTRYANLISVNICGRVGLLDLI